MKNNCMNDETICKICSNCNSCLRKANPTIPYFAPSNSCFIGDVPTELQNLTITEQQLIALYRHNKFVVKIQSRTYDSSTQQTKIRGNVIVFQQNLSSIANVLQLSEEVLCEIIKIIFVGSSPPTRVETKRLLKVRREKILFALNWLIKNNPLYKDIRISKENIFKLPVDDVPNSLWNSMDVTNENRADNDSRSGYANEDVEFDSETNLIDDGTDPDLTIYAMDEENVEAIPLLNISSVVDVDGFETSCNDINEHLLETISENNKTNSGSENKLKQYDRSYYMIPRSEQPVLQFGNDQLLTGLFPTLFPYGIGSPEYMNRIKKTCYKRHIQYLLNYQDKRFEEHASFIFVVFNMLQRRNACYKAKLMMKQPYSISYAHLISEVKSSDIENVLKQIINKNDATINKSKGVEKLVKQIKTVGGSIPGSAQSRSMLRCKIHGLIYSKGLPSIFVTINPADTYSPVALYFAGVDLDLANIIKETFPNAYERSQKIASHPAATAKYFNYLIEAILSTLIMGNILGPTDSYFGTVECQGRGSLHLHMLIWLSHSLKPSDISSLIQDPIFRQNLLQYLEDIIKESIDEFKNINVGDIHNDSDINEKMDIDDGIAKLVFELISN